MLWDKDTGFFNFDRYKDEAALYRSSLEGKYRADYSLSFLEDAMGGLVHGELVVLGADSGVGKSEISNNIAFLNAAKKKNVYLFSLEGHKYDLMNRLVYQIFIQKMKRQQRYIELSYRDYIINKIPQEAQPILDSIEDEVGDKYKTLKVYAREEDLTIDKFEAHFDLIQSKADLIIIDHLHYFEFQKREYDAINEIMKRIKKAQDKHSVPIILVSHLRKKNRDRSFPDQEDFHGSSNICKQADTVIVLAHMPDEENIEQEIRTNVYSTGVRICKSRTGFSQRLVGVHKYDLKSRSYSNDYDIVACGQNFIKDMDTRDYPKWAMNARIHDLPL